MSPLVDLHAHTSASDGELTPGALVAEAARAGLAAVAVTDHDTLDGLEAARAAAESSGLELVPGIELSTYLDGCEFHILGLLTEAPSAEDRALIEMLVQARAERAERMVALLRRAGCRLTIEDVHRQAALPPEVSPRGRAAIGRPHVAQALVAAGDVSSFAKAFGRYLAPGKPAFVPKHEFPPDRACALIHRMNGLAALAHPGVYGRDELLPRLVEAGLDAIEIWHVLHRESHTAHYRAQARKLGLALTGGSDYHGPRKQGARLGQPAVAYEVLEKLKAEKAARVAL